MFIIYKWAIFIHFPWNHEANLLKGTVIGLSSSHGQEGEPLARPHCAATLGQASRAQGGGVAPFARGPRRKFGEVSTRTLW